MISQQSRLFDLELETGQNGSGKIWSFKLMWDDQDHSFEALENHILKFSQDDGYSKEDVEAFGYDEQFDRAVIFFKERLFFEDVSLRKSVLDPVGYLQQDLAEMSIKKYCDERNIRCKFLEETQSKKIRKQDEANAKAEDSANEGEIFEDGLEPRNLMHLENDNDEHLSQDSSTDSFFSYESASDFNFLSVRKKRVEELEGKLKKFVQMGNKDSVFKEILSDLIHHMLFEKGNYYAFLKKISLDTEKLRSSAPYLSYLQEFYRCQIQLKRLFS